MSTSRPDGQYEPHELAALDAALAEARLQIVALLTNAAAKMRADAGDAAYSGPRWRVDVAGPLASTKWLGPSHDALTATWRQAAFVAAWSPALACLVAAWLDDMARGAPRENATHDELPHAIAVARAYLGDAA